MTPINAHDLNSQSIVLGARDVVEIEMGSRRYQKDECAGVSFDGDTVFHLSAGERVRIEPASDAVRICRISNQSFLETLRKKMQN
jgi:NAD+ kinase